MPGCKRTRRGSRGPACGRRSRRQAALPPLRPRPAPEHDKHHPVVGSFVLLGPQCKTGTSVAVNEGPCLQKALAALLPADSKGEAGGLGPQGLALRMRASISVASSLGFATGRLFGFSPIACR